MSREPIRFRNSLIDKRCLKPILWGISRRFQRLSPWNGQVAHALRTLAPVAIKTSTNLSLMLPLDLHVLSLPLAFILSQDQTLHCIIVYKISSLSLTLIILSKELTLLDKLYFFSVLASCTVKQSFQWTCILSLLRDPCFSNGSAKVRIILKPAIPVYKYFLLLKCKYLSTLCFSTYYTIVTILLNRK